MGPPQGRVEGEENLPRPAGHTPPKAPQNPIGFLGSQGTLLVHGQPVVHQDTQEKRDVKQIPPHHELPKTGSLIRQTAGSSPWHGKPWGPFTLMAAWSSTCSWCPLLACLPVHHKVTPSHRQAQSLQHRWRRNTPRLRYPIRRSLASGAAEKQSPALPGHHAQKTLLSHLQPAPEQGYGAKSSQGEGWAPSAYVTGHFSMAFISRSSESHSAKSNAVPHYSDL